MVKTPLRLIHENRQIMSVGQLERFLGQQTCVGTHFNPPVQRTAYLQADNFENGLSTMWKICMN